MAYPEKGATYKHEPAWLDRMKHAEGGKCGPYRQSGGSVPTWANDPHNPASSAYRPPTEHGWVEEGPGDDMSRAPTTFAPPSPTWAHDPRNPFSDVNTSKDTKGD